MPRQDSTADQIADVARFAEEAGHVTVAEWLRAWRDDYARPITEEDLRVADRLAVTHRCYDAHDAILMRTGRHNLQSLPR